MKDRIITKILLLVAAMLVPLAVACSGSNTVSASDIRSVSEGLNCICGSCDELLSECDCEKAGELNTVIRKGLSRGHSEEQIVQDLVRLYGQRILAP